MVTLVIMFTLIIYPKSDVRKLNTITVDIAKCIGNPKASRAVGMANNKNKIIIIVPCHRVIGSNKKLVGYACGLDVKEKLLELERGNV